MAKKTYPTPKKYTIQNKEKYIGNTSQVILRSSWEKKLARFLDLNPAVLKWNSEDIRIPYFSQADGKMRNYHIDFFAQIKNKNGEIKKYLIEVKPYDQTQPPKKGYRKKHETYLNECHTYQVNQDKWQAAMKWAERNDMIFVLMTEYELGLKKKD